MDNRPTNDLVLRVRNGDTAAFDALAEKFRPRVVAWGHLQIGPALLEHIQPDDFAQEVFLRASKAIADFRSEDARGFTAWLFRIAENCANELARHYKANKRQVEPRRARTMTTPSQAAMRTESAAVLLRALAVLTEKERDALTFRLIQGATTGETAELLGIAEGTVRARVCRGLKRLTKELNSLNDGGAQ